MGHLPDALCLGKMPQRMEPYEQTMGELAAEDSGEGDGKLDRRLASICSDIAAETRDRLQKVRLSTLVSKS